MIIVKLKGGLGNQMFQYAAGKLLASEIQHDLILDRSFLDTERKGVTKRTYYLDIYDVKTKQTRNHKSSSTQKLFQKVSYPLLKKIGHTVLVKDFTHSDLSSYATFKNIVLDGYFFDLTFLQDRKEIVTSIFEFTDDLYADNKSLLQQIKRTQSVSIHIRRGDYLNKVNQSIYHSCNISYYQKAIKYIQSKVDQPFFYIFSDDIEWVKKSLNMDVPMELIDLDTSNKDVVDFFLMSQCQHNIIANSTYSWWAAFLNKNKQKEVVAPLDWYKDTVRNTEALKIIPKEWKLI